jgi:hypothetical protein
VGGDWSVLRLAVVGLILLGVTAIVSVTILLYQGDTPPDGLIAIGAGCVGALATLMATTQHGQPANPPNPPNPANPPNPPNA